jgi:hypothetical protein
MTDSVSSFADPETLPWDEAMLQRAKAGDPDFTEVPTGRLATDFVLSGDHMTFSLRPDIGANQFLVTSMLRGIAGNLQFSRVSAEDRLDDMQAQARARMENHEGAIDHPQELFTEAQHAFAEALLDQLNFIEDLFVDLGAFWKQSNDNPAFKLLARSDTEVRQSMRASAERKAAKLASERKAGSVFALNDLAARRQAIAARRDLSPAARAQQAEQALRSMEDREEELAAKRRYEK